MTLERSSRLLTMNRRGFVSLLGAGALSAALAGCAAGGPRPAQGLSFWDMTWGADSTYNADSGKIVNSFRQGSRRSTYQTISWSNYNQTFATAIAAGAGPALSTGAAFQPFQFASYGSVAPADDAISEMKRSGLYDDLVPGTLDVFKTSEGYVGVPWNLDVVVIWYRESALDAAGVTHLPETWDEYATVAEALAKKGTYAFGTGNGSGNSFGYESLFAMMINNGGGLFDPDGNLDLVTPRNIETMEFILELQKMGAIDPGAPSYTTSSYLSSWQSKRIGMGWYDGYLDFSVGAVGDVKVAKPLTSSSGVKATVHYINPIIMYKNTPDQASSNALLQYWLANTGKLWDAKAVPLLPALKSIMASDEFRADKQAVAIAEEWEPIAKTLAAQSTKGTAQIGKLDGSPAAFTFATQILSGSVTAKQALVQFENGILAAVSS